jgi:hypothetical protein
MQADEQGNVREPRRRTFFTLQTANEQCLELAERRGWGRDKARLRGRFRSRSSHVNRLHDRRPKSKRWQAHCLRGDGTRLFDRSQSDGGSGSWTCYCSKTMLLTHTAVVDVQAELNRLAEPLGGYCDGWGTFGNAEGSGGTALTRSCSGPRRLRRRRH